MRMKFGINVTSNGIISVVRRMAKMTRLPGKSVIAKEYAASTEVRRLQVTVIPAIRSVLKKYRPNGAAWKAFA